MLDVKLKLDAESKDNYENAKKLLLETGKAVEKLTPQERQKLVQEYFECKGMLSLYYEIKRCLVGDKTYEGINVGKWI